jgi:hypothetical protein
MSRSNSHKRKPKKLHKSALKGWETRRANELRAEREAARLSRIRSAAAARGWETRRREAEEAEREKKRRAKQRREGVEAKALKEAERLRKWRKSYQKYLEFRIPKAEREELEVPAKKELVCKVLFDADEIDPREEHFWANVRYLIGDSVSNQLVRIPAEEGMCKMTLRVILEEEFADLQRGDIEPEDAGELIAEEFDVDLEPDAFWSTFFDHARALLPKNKEGKSGGSLLVVKLEVCYYPGEVSAD